LKLKNWLLFEPERKISGWLKFALFLGLFSLINYLPALNQSYDPFAEYQNNLSNFGAGLLHIYISPGWPTENDYTLYWEMDTAKNLVKGIQDGYNVHTSNPQVHLAPPPMQVPLWRWDDRDGGRPLLTVSPGPFLYPFTGIFYLLNLAFFAAFHFWLALLGAFLLSTYFPVKIKLFGRPLLLILVIICLPQLRFDLAAALAWWLVGSALTLTLADKRFSINLVALSFILAMLWLAVSTPVAVILTGSLGLWWLLVAEWKNNWRVGPLLKGLAGVVLAVLLGTLLAGPQLFPRLFDRMEPYQLPPDQTPVYLPSTVSLNSVTRVSETEIVYSLAVEGSASRLQLTIPERYDPGWTAEYRLNQSGSEYQSIPLNRTEQGWRNIILPSIPAATTLEIKTIFSPASFRIGVWCCLAGLAAWFIIAGLAVYPFLAKTFSKNRASSNLKFSGIS
jgi:hypothetical protein